MINLKKGLVAVAGLAMVAGVGGVALTSCGNDPYANIVTVWAPESDVTYFRETVIPAFKAANPDVLKIKDADGNVTGELDIQVTEIVGEGDIVAGSENINEVADVFCMADDNTREMVARGYLLDFEDVKTERVASDGQGAIDSFTINDKLYGLPYRNDNSYMLYYNTDIVTDEDAKTLEGILAAAKKVNGKVHFQIANTWTFPSVLFSEGEVHVETIDGTTYQMTDFGSNAAVADALYEFVQLYVEYKDTVVGVEGIQTDTILNGLASSATEPTAAYIIYNFWNDTAKKLDELGLPEDSVKVTTLPTFGNNRQMKPFIGYKGMGVKSSVADNKKDAAVAFAKFATNGDMQAKRITDLKQGVTNLEASEEHAAELAALPHMVAINETIAKGEDAYVPQGVNVTGAFWSGVDPLAKGLLNDPTKYNTLDACKEALQTIAEFNGWKDVSTVA